MRYLKLAFAALLLAANAWAAGNIVTIEVRPGVGSDSNAGVFRVGGTGTDFSQQNSAQFSFTDLASSNGTTNPCIVTSASHNFTSTDVGNGIKVNAGTNWTAGLFTIVSTSSNAATLDFACGSAASLTGGTWREGGALNSVSAAIAVDSAEGCGNVSWVKATGTYTTSVAQAFNCTSGGTGAPPSTITGYTSSRGDNGRFTWTTATNSINILALSTTGVSAGFTLNNIAFTNTAGTKGTGTTGNAIAATAANAFMVVINNCSFDGFNTALGFDWNVTFTANPLYLFNSEIKNSVASGVVTTAGSSFIGNYIHDNGGDGVRITSQTNSNAQIGQVSVLNNIFYNNTGIGLSLQQTQSNPQQYITVVGNDFSNNGSDGIRFANGTQETAILNNIFYSNGGWGINQLTSAQPVSGVVVANAFGSNTSGTTTNFTPGTGTSPVTLTADPFVGRTSANFALNSTAGGGAAVRAKGFPGVLANGGTGFVDIGALQHQDAGGGATMHVYPIVQ